jgi:Xaa-Pro aminopeptidase
MFTTGLYNSFETDMVVTVEPIYIPIGSDCDKKMVGIAVRIEDDILITNGP